MGLLVVDLTFFERAAPVFPEAGLSAEVMGRGGNEGGSIRLLCEGSSRVHLTPGSSKHHRPLLTEVPNVEQAWMVAACNPLVVRRDQIINWQHGSSEGSRLLLKLPL